MDGEIAESSPCAEMAGVRLTPLVVRGSEGGTRLLNSPWALFIASAFLLADMMNNYGFRYWEVVEMIEGR